jgi:thiosulfate dehydrogenase (quinone) large subunit
MQLPIAAEFSAAALRITLGLIYLWGFIAQGFGVIYSNTSRSTPPTYGWHFAYDSGAGWISSGFKSSPTVGYIAGTHGPLAFIVRDVPQGLADFGWMFAIRGLWIALTLGICMRIAGWGGFVLNLLIWFSAFPPSLNPVIDGTHTIYAILLLTLMWMHAGNRWGLGRWWGVHTAPMLH